MFGSFHLPSSVGHAVTNNKILIHLFANEIFKLCTESNLLILLLIILDGQNRSFITF